MSSSLLLDVSRLIWRAWRRQLPTGIDRLCLAYVRHYRNSALAMVQRGGATRVLSRALSRSLFDLLIDPPANVRPRFIRLLLKAVTSPGVPIRQLRGALYLNVGHTGLDRPGHARWVRRSGVRAVYYVHDLIPITHPQFARAGQQERHALRMRTVLKCASAVIANSEDSIANLAAFARTNNLPMPPALCAPLAGKPSWSMDITTRPVPQPYFITVGTIEGRKNHLLLLRIWRRLIERLGEQTPRLVIIGQRGWQAEEVFRQLDHDPLLRGHIIELGRCDDRELQRYLAHAQALLFPSFVEGQGLPLTEALAAGTPVIASNLAVFRESAGLIPEYLNPDDDKGWIEMILRYAEPESAARAAQIARMASFRPFTWDEHFVQVETWLSDLGLLPVSG